MQVVTSKEFRANQKKYFDLAEKESVFVTRVGKTPIALTPVDLKNYPTEEEILAIKKGLEDIEKGRGTKIKDINNIWESIL